MGCHFLLQGIFPTQGSNPGLLYCRQILYQLSYKGSPRRKKKVREKKVREYQNNIYFCFIDYAKVFDCVDHNKLWKILKEMGIPDHLTCLLKNLYANQEATVSTRHEQLTGSELEKESVKVVY